VFGIPPKDILALRLSTIANLGAYLGPRGVFP
jgi:hypothetical protein